MRKPYDKLPKKCVIAIMAAATLMSIEAQSTICPMVVYADTPTDPSCDINTTDLNVSGQECVIASNVSSVTVHVGGIVNVSDNSGGITVNNGGTVNVGNNYQGAVLSSGVEVRSGGSGIISNNEWIASVYEGGTMTVNMNSGSAIASGGTMTVTSNVSSGTVVVRGGGSTIVSENYGSATASGGTMAISRNVSGGTVFVSGGGRAAISENCGAAIVSNGSLTISSIDTAARVNVSSGGTVTAHDGFVTQAIIADGGTLVASKVTDVTVEVGGYLSCGGIMSGGSNTIKGSAIMGTLISGARINISGGVGTLLYNSGDVVTVSSGDVTISNNFGSGGEGAYLFASGTVINNYGCAVLGSGSAPSYGTVVNNYGTSILSCGGTVENNHVGGVILGSSGVVLNNYGCTLESGVTVTNQYWSVSVTGLGANYDSSFRNISGGSYLQTISGGAPTGASGQIVIRPTGGYEFSGSGPMSGSTATYNYTLTRSGDNYILTISDITGNVVISPEQLQLVLTAIRSAGGSSDDGEVITEIVPSYFSSAETTKMIDNILDLTQKATGLKVPLEVTLDLKAVRGFEPDSAKTIFEYKNLMAKRLIFTVNGKRYEIVIPAGIKTKSKKFLKALAKLEETEKKEIVGPLKFAEIFRECGVTVRQLN